MHIAVWEEGESPPNTHRSRLSLNDDPSLCDTLHGVDGLYQRRSALLCNRFTVQTATPIRTGDERERLVTVSPVMTKNGPSWGKQLPGERPRETAET